jgi:hypothetical protein
MICSTIGGQYSCQIEFVNSMYGDVGCAELWWDAWVVCSQWVNCATPRHPHTKTPPPAPAVMPSATRQATRMHKAILGTPLLSSDNKPWQA